MKHRFSKNFVDCAGVALTNAGRIFLIRPFYDFRPQNYAIPKGHVEPGENPIDTAIREFTEETGIDISNLELSPLVKVYTKIKPDVVKRVHVFRANGTGNEVFKSSNISPTGSPENAYGNYIPFSDAKILITNYQLPIITTLMSTDNNSFSKFYDDRISL